MTFISNDAFCIIAYAHCCFKQTKHSDTSKSSTHNYPDEWEQLLLLRHSGTPAYRGTWFENRCLSVKPSNREVMEKKRRDEERKGKEGRDGLRGKERRREWEERKEEKREVRRKGERGKEEGKVVGESVYRDPRPARFPSRFLEHTTWLKLVINLSSYILVHVAFCNESSILLVMIYRNIIS